MTKIHQINETHIGDTCTANEARAVAKHLTTLGYPSEYNGMQGVASFLIDDATGDQIDIPESVWAAALTLTYP